MATAADNKARILFIDDEPRILVALKALFAVAMRFVLQTTALMRWRC